jgi:hypothetical protein
MQLKMDGIEKAAAAVAAAMQGQIDALTATLAVVGAPPPAGTDTAPSTPPYCNTVDGGDAGPPEITADGLGGESVGFLCLTLLSISALPSTHAIPSTVHNLAINISATKHTCHPFHCA